MSDHFDVVVIGGGTAGLVTASGCARLGRRVALIERAKLGGDCLWTGCVPTKALVASAKVAHQMRNAGAFGLEPVEPRISPRAVMESMRATRRTIEPHDAPEKFRALGIDVIEGDAKLVSRDKVEVAGRTLTAKDIVIATGSRTAVPPIDGLAEAGYLDHASFLDRDEFPASIVILGGGPIGIEFAQIFRRFGCEVTVVEAGDEIVNKEDHDVIALVRKILTAEGVTIRTKSKVTGVRVANGKKLVRLSCSAGFQPAPPAPDEGWKPAPHEEEITADEIFVASGRRGNTENLGLEALGMKMNHSYIAVDDYLQTSVPRIWAIGDVHGGMQFTHVAAYEAVKLVRNMLFPGRSRVDYDDVPWGLYTDPEFGHIGMTEQQAREKLGDSIKIYRVDMADVDRAVVDRTTHGFLKLVCDAKGHILGAHAICSNATTLIEEIVLARRKKMKIGELAQLVSPYPSLADSIGKSGSLYYQDVAASWLGAFGRRIAGWSQ
jgi:pyruvate/2-oxoglutarate dehydrogenase complex dihydrolipoamide dehydrogenase (E3) component